MESSDILGYVLLGLGVLVLLALAFASFFTVQQQRVVAVERFGKFARFARAGLNVKIPLIESVAHEQTLRVQDLDVEVETKTSDNVFVNLQITIQYYVLEDKLQEAFYRLSNPNGQMIAYVQDTVRGQVPKMELDSVFENKDDIAQAVQQSLSDSMKSFGYGIQNTLVTEVDPDEKVKVAMNEINAAKRERVAAEERGEAARILVVKNAQAEAESKKLQGEGIANQRKAIINGLQESVDVFQKAIPTSTAEDVMRLVLMTQYLDTLKEIGANGKSNTVFIPHSPGGLSDLESQIRNAVMSADAGTKGATSVGSGKALAGTNGSQAAAS